MKCIATYPAYDLANDRQIDLITAEIEATVWYVPTGMEQVYLGALPVYALLVPPEKVELATEIIQLVADESHQCIYGCPNCGSDRVKEQSLEDSFLARWWVMDSTLAMTAFISMLVIRAKGRVYVCQACGGEIPKEAVTARAECALHLTESRYGFGARWAFT
jgi:predicted RNA-binding Zn-ribbon protein involved in translation (DUF1610 family)